MKKTQFILLVAFMLCFVTISYAQHQRYAIRNGFGIEGGLTQFNIITDNFETKQGNGWLAGASATVDIPHKWYNISYSIQLSENTVGLSARPSATTNITEFIDYKIFAAQIALKSHVKLIGSYLTVDVGPMLQYNSEFEVKEDRYKSYFLTNYEALLAEDISKISRFHINGTIGLSAGFSHFRIKAQYIYGFTNMFNKLNKNNLNVGSNTRKFKGNQSMFAFTAMITF